VNTIWLANTPDTPCPGSSLFHVTKFLSGWEGHGYRTVTVTAVEDLDPAPTDVVYLSNHGVHGQVTPTLTRVSESGAFPILWFWHDHLTLAGDLFGERFILTGEHFHQPPGSAEHQGYWQRQQIPQYEPCTFAAAIHPDNIGTAQRIDTVPAVFIGNGYEPELNTAISNAHPGTRIINTPPFIPESERLQHYAEAIVCLGWVGAANIANNVIVERVFEGLAYGNITITNSALAEQHTDGTAIYVTSASEAIELIRVAVNNPAWVREHRERAWKWVGAHGTYHHVAARFLDRIRTLT
jgi:hypothetical protein